VIGLADVRDLDAAAATVVDALEPDRTAAEFMAARSGSSIGSARVQLRPSDPGWALVEGTGNRPMVRPGDPRHPKNKPKWDSG
jgi:hypothetical protein